MSEHTPTPAEIREACQRIQAGWTDRERARREGYQPWQPQTIGLTHGPHGIRGKANAPPPLHLGIEGPES